MDTTEAALGLNGGITEARAVEIRGAIGEAGTDRVGAGNATMTTPAAVGDNEAEGAGNSE